MAYSDKLNGFWEEGYHFYFEIRDDKLTVREYRRKITLETTIEYDAAGVEAGVKTLIKLADNVLSYGGSNNPMSWFEEMYYEDGLIQLMEGYSFMDRKDPYTLKKVERGPFDHIIIRDDEYHDFLEGEWVQWSVSGDYSKKETLYIHDNEFHWRLHGGKFHVVTYNYDRESVYLVPWDLTESDFRSCTQFRVYPDMLTTNEIICDMSTPVSVFAREENIEKIEVPGGAKTGGVSVMGPGAYAPIPWGEIKMVSGKTLFDVTKEQQQGFMNGMMDGSYMNDQSNPAYTAAVNGSGSGNDGQKTSDGGNPSSQGSTPSEEEPAKCTATPEFIPVRKDGDDPYRLKKPYACPNCKTIFEDRLAHFCWNCGQPLR
ncbi:MAG: zinc ribbon domain-containing protein [Lachnospiraceae bacterium]|nr:zinc ribbon domain-containing protein [Lachnospiraceae bacterium]